ncbi:hypothetical protein P7C70_g1892, partial [Phenoliferia sp. Uapishka_3]
MSTSNISNSDAALHNLTAECNPSSSIPKPNPKPKATPAPKKTKAAPKPKATSSSDWADVEIPTLANGDIPVYDCCTTIRKKITAYLAEGNTAASFLRDIGGMNSNSLARFKKETGPNGGAANQYVHPTSPSTSLSARLPSHKPPKLTRLIFPESTLQPARPLPPSFLILPLTPPQLPTDAFFERRRIFDQAKKTPSRIKAEGDYPQGRELEQRRYMWVKN